MFFASVGIIMFLVGLIGLIIYVLKAAFALGTIIGLVTLTCIGVLLMVAGNWLYSKWGF